MMKHLGVCMGFLVGLVCPLRADTQPLAKVAINWQSGVAYNATYHQLFASSTVSAIKVWDAFDLRVGSLFTDTQTLWTAGIGVDVKALCNKLGGVVQYTLPFELDLAILPAINLSDQKVSVSLNATILKVSF